MINGKFAVPPTLSDALEYHRADAAAQLRVALPGQIVTYNTALRTAEVQVLYNRVYNDGTVVPINCKLVDVPMFTLQGGGVHIGLPITPGDQCWVFFADINIDAWHETGEQQTPYDRRRHDIADGFAFVGPNALAKPLVTALLATEGGLSGALSKVAIDKETGLITIANATANLMVALTMLLEALTALNIGIAAESGTIPTAASAATAANVAIALVQVQLDALLY